MLTRITNDLGAISIDDNIINEVLNETMRSFPNNAVRLSKESRSGKIAEMNNSGVFVYVEYIIKFGTSISEVANRSIEAIRALIEDQLELKVSNIQVKIAGIQTVNAVVPRDILYDYVHGGLVYWND